MLIWETRFTREDAWEQEVGKHIEIEGIAHNLKQGAMVNDLWIDGLHDWPGDYTGKNIRVTGTLIRRDDLPVFRPAPNDPPTGGIPVPEGVDLERARRRYLIANAQWTKIPD